MWASFHWQLGSVVGLRGISKSFFLSVIFGSGSGQQEGSVSCNLFGDAFWTHGVVQCYQEYLLFVPVKTDKVFERMF